MSYSQSQRLQSHSSEQNMTQENKQSCFHCGLPIPSGSAYCVNINGNDEPMCCAGCEAVARAIVENGLTDFYQYRSEKTDQARVLVPDELRELELYDRADLQKGFVRETGEHTREASLILEGIVCAACIWLNEQHVKALPGVEDFQVNYSTHRARVIWDNDVINLSQILEAIQAIGYQAHPFDVGRQEQVFKQEKSLAMRRLAVAGLGMMQVMMLAVALYAGAYEGMSDQLKSFLRWVSLLLTTPVVLYSARPFFERAWKDLKRRQAGMDVPVALAIGGAFLASAWATIRGVGDVYFDSVNMFTFFLLTGRYLEMAARHRAGQAAEELVKLLPATATRLEDNEQVRVSVAELTAADRVLIKPGETVPADGVVLEGSSLVDESLLTGESLPLPRKPGDALVGGTVNADSPLVMQVNKVGEDTVLSAIVRLLDRAQTEKPSLARLADKVAGWFVLVLLLLAGLVALWWWQHSPQEAFRVTLSILVVTCPCALSLATPATLSTATGALTRLGVLTTRGHALESLAKVTRLIFDKTGTLTEGRLQLSGVQIPDADASAGRDELISMAAALERSSEHPVAMAFLQAVEGRSVSAAQIKSVPGEGIEGLIEGRIVRLGNPDFVATLVASPVPEVTLDQQQTIVFLGVENTWLGIFSLADKLRVGATDTISSLHALGIQTELLSGDQPGVVETMARQAGISVYQASCSPQDKLQRIQALQARGEIVGMVGDGVNDAPVLAAAQISIAMGSGTQLAQASADMVLLSEQLPHLVIAARVARKTRQVIQQNLAWAVLYNLLALPLAAMGLIAPWMAAIGMSLSSLIVVVNALRLRKLPGAAG
ncbi:MAG: heavy metal translocating P-type ATPase [Gammaproteobacteria bacterium]